jgi:hypothetical protein
MSDPVLTCNHHVLIAHPRLERHGRLTAKTRMTMSRYGLRGFTFGHTFADLLLSTTQRWYLKCNPEYACPHCVRFVGDRFTAVGVFRLRHAEGGTYPLSTGEWVTGGGVCEMLPCAGEDPLSQETMDRISWTTGESRYPVCCGSYNDLVPLVAGSAICQLFKA